MKYMMFFPVVLAVAGLPAMPVRADVFSMNGSVYQVEHVTGTGANKALLELDFGTNASPQAYLFGYQWNGPAITGRDVLLAIENDHIDVSFTETFFASFDSYLLNTLWYKTNQPADAYPNSFWYAFTSPEGSSWTFSDAGYDHSTLSDGSFFGWALQHDDPNFGRDFSLPPLPPSHFPAAIVVPEPSSLALLGMGLACMMMRRRRRES